MSWSGTTPGTAVSPAASYAAPASGAGATLQTVGGASMQQTTPQQQQQQLQQPQPAANALPVRQTSQVRGAILRLSVLRMLQKLHACECVTELIQR